MTNKKYGSFGRMYLGFNVNKSYIKLERLAKLNKNLYKMITLILIDFFIKLFAKLFLICLIGFFV